MPMHSFRKRLEVDEIVLQTSISVEKKEGRILPTGQMSCEAMRPFSQYLASLTSPSPLGQV
jgi:hypothetical protein